MRKQVMSNVINFHHLPAAALFRMACLVSISDQSTEEILLLTAKIRHFFTGYMEALKPINKAIKLKTNKVLRRRATLANRYSAEALFPRKALSQTLYEIAVAIENNAERHFIKRSEESYVDLLKISNLLLEAVRASIGSLVNDRDKECA